MIKIRKANLADMTSILDLVKELAVYEEAADEVTATVQIYEENFKQNVFDALVAEKENGHVCGVALYYLTFSTWKGRMLYLEDFVVQSSERGAGIGALIFNQLIEEAKQLDCQLMKWQVLDWNEPAVNFYKKYDATFETNWWNVKLFPSLERP